MQQRQLDLETLVVDGEEEEEEKKPGFKTMLDSDSSTELPPDFPAESFYLPKEDEFEWFDRNAFYERNESTKGNSVSTTSNSNPASQRFSTNLKSKASIIGLPKPQNTCYTNNHHHSRQNCNKPSTARFFPKRLRSSGKSPIPLTEPSSPKVSCIGRVRSKRQGSRRQRLRRQRSKKAKAAPPLQAVRPEKKTGFWGNLKAAFMSKCRRKKVGSSSGKQKVDEPVSFVSEKTETARNSTASEPAGLSELKRFTSGRRVESWVEVGDDDGGDVEMAESGSVWGRRGLGPRKGVDCCDRNLVDVGPATV